MRLFGTLVRVVGWPLQTGTTRPERADAIVIVGAPLVAGERIGPVVEERLRAGVELWRAGVAPILCVSGGRTRGEKLAEAEAMEGWARGGGVPAGDMGGAHAWVDTG